MFTVAEAALALDHRRTWARPPGAARCGSFCGSHQMRASRLCHDSTGQGGGTAPRGPRPVAVPRPWPLATTSLSCLHVCSRLDGLLVPFYCLTMSRRPDGPQFVYPSPVGGHLAVPITFGVVVNKTAARVHTRAFRGEKERVTLTPRRGEVTWQVPLRPRFPLRWLTLRR